MSGSPEKNRNGGMQVVKIVVTKRVPGLDEALQKLPDDADVWVHSSQDTLDRDELAEAIQDAQGVLVVGDRFDAELMDAAPHLKVLSNYGVGVDNIDVDAAATRGIVVKNLPHEVTYSTAELAIALLLACARRIPEADRFVRSHNPFSWTPTIIMGDNLQGKTLGIVGFGRIGQKVAKMARAFDMKIVYYSRTRKRDVEESMGVGYLDLPDLLRRADAVSLHTPGGDDTRHLIGTAELAMMPPHAILVNLARGSVVDEEALADALEAGSIRAAGLDVYEHEPAVNTKLTTLPNVVLTPHIGTTTWQARQAMTEGALAHLASVLWPEEGAT